MKKLLYLHGFASSGASGTVGLLRRELFEKRKTDKVAVVAPDIPVDPMEALPMLRELANAESPDLIIGTSMGGGYAQQLRGFKRICVNPSFGLSGLHSVLSVGKHKWLSRRQDGTTEFRVTKEIIAHFKEMESHQFEGVCDEDRLLCHGLFGTQDSLLRADNRVLFERHYPGLRRMFEGGHRMNDDVVKNVLLPWRNGCFDCRVRKFVLLRLHL